MDLRIALLLLGRLGRPSIRGPARHVGLYGAHSRSVQTGETTPSPAASGVAPWQP
jgi:hypothetical protein